MKQIPFVSQPLPRGELQALLGALRQAGVAMPSLCVSRQELPASAAEGATAWVTVTGAGWCRSYDARPGWERQLLVDLQVNAGDAVPGARA